jgi:hypothetical protein
MVKHEADYDYIRPTKFSRYSVWIAPAAIFIGAYALYIKTMAPSVFWGDSAAFAASNYILGLPHSPSFPLYTLIGRLFNLIPSVSPSFSTNLMSAFFAALAVMFFYLIIKYLIDVPVFIPALYRQMLANRKLQQPDAKNEKQPIDYQSVPKPFYVLVPGLVVSSLFAVSLPVWLSAVRAEVYSLHLFLTLAAVYFCLKAAREEKQRHYFLGLWLYAISFTNHPLLALAFAPAFLYLIIINFAIVKKWFGVVTVVVLFFAAAFTVYLYLPFRSALEPAINWGRPDNLDSFLAALTRSGDMASFSEMLKAPDYFLRLKKIGLFMAGQIGWPLLGLWLIGLVGIHKISRRFSLFFFLAILSNLGVVLWAADFDPKNYDMVNYLAPLTAIVLIIGSAGILYLLRKKVATSRALIFFSVFAGIFLFVGVEKNFPRADMSQVTGPDIISYEVLNNLPPDAIVLTAEDDLLLPLWYGAYVDSIAQGISILSPGAMVNPAYRKQLTVNYPYLAYPPGFADDSAGQPDSLARELCRLNSSDRDICVQFGVPGISHAELVPDGILFRFVGPDHKAGFDENIYRRHLELADKMLAGNPLEARTIDFTGRWLFTIGVYYDRIGKGDIAWQLFNKALAVDASSIDMRIRLASALAKAGRYTEALKFVAQALDIDSQDQTSLELGQKIVEAIEKQKAIASK